MKQTNERLCALAQKGDATALDSLIDNNKSFIGKVANDLFRSMNLAQAGLNLDTDDLKQAGNLGLWKAVPKFDAARGMKFMTYAAPAIRNAMMDMVRDAFAAFEQRMVTEDKDGICYQRVSLDDVLPGEEQLRRILQDLIFGVRPLKPMPSSRWGIWITCGWNCRGGLIE